MKKFIFLTLGVFVYLVYGLYLAYYDVRVLPEDLAPEAPRGFFDYRGITNVHTQLSSGSGDMAEVISAAQAAGLDFLSVTDLNIFDKPNSFSGYHGSLLVMIDGEYSYLNSRLLNIGARTSRHLQGVGRSQVLFADLLSQSERDPELGLFVLAHPTKPKFQWNGPYPKGLDGLEVINLKEIWQEAWLKNKPAFFLSLLIFPFNEELALLRLFRAPDDVVRLWDELSRERRIFGLTGADAEARFLVDGRKSLLHYPSYQTLFSIARNHLLLRSELTGNATTDLAKIDSAIRQGNFYFSLDILGNPKGFNAVLKGPNGQVLPMGSEAAYGEGWSLEISLPQKPKVPFETVVFKNGEKVLTSNAQVTQYFLNGPGVYRVMIRVIPTLPLPDGKKWIPWIYTNPFYVSSGPSSASGTRTTKPGSGAN